MIAALSSAALIASAAGPFAGVTTPTPTPLPFDPNDVTPGVIGFGFTFVIFLLVGLVAWDLLRRVRRNTYRHQVREQIAAEVAAGAEASGPGAPESASDGDDQAGPARGGPTA